MLIIEKKKNIQRLVNRIEIVCSDFTSRFVRVQIDVMLEIYR